MATTTYPAPLTTNTPPGATGIIFQGVSSAGDYTYTTSLPAGKYILTGMVGSNGNTYWSSSSNYSNTVTGISSSGITFLNFTATETAFNVFSSWNVLPTSVMSTGIGNTQFNAGTWGVSSTQIIAPNSTSNTVSVSTNGLTWSTRSAPFTVAGPSTSIAYNAGVTNQYIAFSGNAADTNNQFCTSTDGVTWTARAGANAVTGGGCVGDINAAATNKYVATTGANGNSIQTSTNGVTWTSRLNTGIGNSIQKIATNGTAATNQIYVATGSNLTTAISSTDGVTWATRTLPLGAASVIFANGLYVAQGTGISTSTDGVTWTSRVASIASGNLYMSFSNGKFWVAPVGGYYLSSSTDGITWSSKKILDTATSTITGGPVVTIGENTYFLNASWVGRPQPAYYTLYSTTGAATLN